MPLRLVFFGTPRFAATILEYVISKGGEVEAVVTKPDKASGRSSALKPSAVKEVALRHRIPVFQPLKASTAEFAATMRELKPDLFVVVAYSEIFKESLLTLPRLGCINVHASLLPKYRGAAPIQRALMAGEKETGVTIMSMERELDAGEMLAVAKVEIGPNTTSGELFETLAELGKEKLWQVLEQFEKGEVKKIKQDPTFVTYASKVTVEEAEVDWNRKALELHNHVRALTPKPGAWCWIELRGEKRRLLIKKTAPLIDLQKKPGEILSNEGLLIGCKEGALNLLELQLEGKKPLPIEEFLKGVSKKELSFLLK